MPSMQTRTQSGRANGPHRAHPVLDAVRAHLLALKRPVDAEIRAYPPPIPACDAQFNYLLDRRAELSRALLRLDDIADLPPDAAAGALVEFIDGCGQIDAEAAARFHAALA